MSKRISRRAIESLFSEDTLSARSQSKKSKSKSKSKKSKPTSIAATVPAEPSRKEKILKILASTKMSSIEKRANERIKVITETKNPARIHKNKKRKRKGGNFVDYNSD
ncbi:hypothetical protein AYI68_g715 [Smittium mucronatum]|uniref:Uncharacterized protein n=1 Tax=Smittium mucronatum TaxID=133383 RepID=A0A1R0H7N6_9FUNG|nr:hypothetical protein AYI68_g715 [Smittium mucronatum]